MMYQYKLLFASPVHFGMEGIGQERIEERIRSDSLWGAVIQKWLLLYDDEPDALCQAPPFHISSTFPIIGENMFFPLPLGSLDHLIGEAAESDNPKVLVKDLKKIRFLAEPLFNKVVSGGRLAFGDIISGQVFPSPPGNRCETEQEEKTAASVIQRPRLEVDRLHGGGVEGQFFYCSDQFFREDGGLFFLAVFDNKDTQEKFEAALRLLGDSGLGADRSVGRGLFAFIRQDYVVQKTRNKDAFVLLSLFHPRRDEVENGICDAGNTAYSLVKRYGHAASHATTSFRRHDLWMLEEGSILGMKPEGDIPVVLESSTELGIPHNVYRNGRAFYLPLTLPLEVRP